MGTVYTIPPGQVTAVEVFYSPSISFSAEFLEERMGVVTIEPKPVEVEGEEEEDVDSGDEGVLDLEKSCTAEEFEFLSTNASLDSMIRPLAHQSALFCEGAAEAEEAEGQRFYFLVVPTYVDVVVAVIVFLFNFVSSSTMADVATKERTDEGKVQRGRRKEEDWRGQAQAVRIRPMINVPICTEAKSSILQQPLFPLKKGRVEW